MSNSMPFSQTQPVNASGLPACVFKVVKDKKEEKFWLEPVINRWELPTKIYGDLTKNAIRIWNHYAKKYSMGGGSVGALLTGHSGAGKALRAKTKIKTPSSWVPIKDIKVGDLVMTPKGNPTKVKGVYPQGKKQLYLVEFIDGRKIECCIEHLWKVAEYGDIHNYQILNTEAMLEFVNIPNYNVAVPLVNYSHVRDDKPLSYTYKELIEIGEKIKDNVLERIPQILLRADDYTRLTILQGIMNIHDNITNIHGQVVLCNSFLTDDVIYLARSLGLIATLTKNNDMFVININYDKYNQLIIKSITPSVIDDAICIEVEDEEHLYVAEDFVVTHNTETAKILCNIAIDHNMPVIEVSNITCTMELVNYLSGFSNCVLFLDEFAKNFGQLQEMMLTMLSDVYKTNKIFIITENDENILYRFILNSPSRLRYHFPHKRIDRQVIVDYSEDMGVKESFLKELLEKHDKSIIFSFNHLKAIVEEHLDYPEDSLDKITSVLNVSILNATSVYKITKVYDTIKKEEVKFNSSTVDVKYFDEGSPFYLRILDDNQSSYKYTREDVFTTEEDGNKILLRIDKYVVTLEKTKNTGGASGW